MTDLSDLRSAYQASLRGYWIRYSKVSALVAFFMVPAGITLDYAVYPSQAERFAAIRIIFNFLIGASFLACYTHLGKKFIREITFLWLLAIQAMICFMILETEGPVSPYYAGLNLAVLAVGLFLPTNVFETLFFCVATLFLYLTSILSFDVHSQGFGVVYNNIYFLVLNAIVMSLASYFGDRRRFEEFRLTYELDRRNKELAALDQTKSEFFANISHELRTPLTLILSPVQDLLESQTPFSDKVAMALGTIRNNALRLLKLVNDLLDVIRLEEGKLDLEEVPVAIDPLIAGISDSIGYLADIQGIELEKSLKAEQQLVLGDVAAIEKVFINILNNAVKFCEKGGRVEISSVSNKDTIFVTVKDTGIGIASSDLPFVFDRFKQADGSSTRRYRGTGLGLALVKDIVERHSGKVHISSVLGKGTTVIVELPKYQTCANEQIEKVSFTPLSIGLQQLHRLAEVNAGLSVDSNERWEEVLEHGGEDDERPSVLVVDDEPDMRRYLVTMLSSEFRIFEADNGANGLKLAQDKLPDAMVLDLMLPEIDGLTVCRLVKENSVTRGIRVILLTARTDEEAKLTALKNGADDFITKPFSSVEVRTRLANLYKTAQLEKNLAKSNKEVRNALKRLKATQAQLIQSEKLNALGSLAAGLLHEINNPLNYSLTALQLIRGDASIRDNELVQEVVGDIDEGMQRIRAIVSDLRAFAYPSEAEKRLPFDFQEALDSARRFTSHELTDIRVESHLTQDTMVMGSKNHITQVLVNLLLNSVKAIKEVSDGRRGEVHVSGETRNARLLVTVADNGIGMDKTTLSRVFDPFFTTRDVGEGMGLGLSVCHTIVANHGGQLAARSTPGMGTEFEFDLPLARDTRIEAKTTQSAAG